MTRAKDIASIDRLDPKRGQLFEDAIAELVFRVGDNWFTDEQIRDIRENITISERNRMKRQAESRAEYAALNTRNAA